MKIGGRAKLWGEKIKSFRTNNEGYFSQVGNFARTFNSVNSHSSTKGIEKVAKNFAGGEKCQKKLDTVVLISFLLR